MPAAPSSSPTYQERFTNPYVAANRGYLDDVIDPASTRATVIRALEMLQNKRDNPAGQETTATSRYNSARMGQAQNDRAGWIGILSIPPRAGWASVCVILCCDSIGYRG